MPSQFQNELKEYPAYFDVSKYNINGTPSKRLMIVLRTSGCSYSKCTMCGFKNASIQGISSHHLQKQIEHALTAVALKLDEIRYLSILGLGSFFNSKEIPAGARENILKRAVEIPTVKIVQVESRIEYLTAEKLKKTSAIIASKELEIAIGIESSNRYIRNNILKKKLSWNKLKEKLALFKQEKIGLVAYILIKPPTLIEMEAVKDAVKSCNDTVNLAKEYDLKVSIALEPTFVVSHTPLEKEFLAGKYKPINLWSLIEIIKRTHHLCPIFIGLSDEGLVENNNLLGLKARTLPDSCPICRKELLGIIQEFNYTQDISVFNRLNCEYCNGNRAE